MLGVFDKTRLADKHKVKLAEMALTHDDWQLIEDALGYLRNNHEDYWTRWVAADVRPSEHLGRLDALIARVQAEMQRDAPPATGEGEPLPCPFCGGTSDIEEDGLGGTSIWCGNPNCPVQVEYTHHVGRGEAVAEWNRRAQEAPPQGS